MFINVLINTCLLVTCFQSQGLAVTYLSFGLLWVVLQIDNFRIILALNFFWLPKKENKNFEKRVLIFASYAVLIVALMTVIINQQIEKSKTLSAEIDYQPRSNLQITPEVQQVSQSEVLPKPEPRSEPEPEPEPVRQIAKEGCDWIEDSLKKFMWNSDREAQLNSTQTDVKLHALDGITNRTTDWKSLKITTGPDKCKASLSEIVTAGPGNISHIINIKFEYDLYGDMTLYHEILIGKLAPKPSSSSPSKWSNNHSYTSVSNADEIDISCLTDRHLIRIDKLEGKLRYRSYNSKNDSEIPELVLKNGMYSNIGRCEAHYRFDNHAYSYLLHQKNCERWVLIVKKHGQTLKKKDCN